jgi:hypothetical protein
MGGSILEDLITWIDTFVTAHNDTFKGIPCPYARKAIRDQKVSLKKSDDLAYDLMSLKLDWDDRYEAVVLYADTKLYSVSYLQEIIQEWNKLAMPLDLVALEDHPKDPEFVKGVEMNFGKAILVIVQRLSALNQASDKLSATGYYDDWEQESYNDVVAWRK